MRLTIISLTFLLVTSIFVQRVCAETEDYYAIAMQAQVNSDRMTEKYKSEIPALTKNQEKLTSVYKSEVKNIVDQSVEHSKYDERNSTSQTEKMPKSNVLIFISFSMPESSIKQIINDASKIHADVVIRGLINNSFKDTMLKMNEFVKSTGGGVELNPVWFKRFGINKVPAYVVVPENSRCFQSDQCSSDEDYDVIYGDMSLESALTEIENKGNVASVTSAKYLKKLRGSVDA